MASRTLGQASQALEHADGGAGGVAAAALALQLVVARQDGVGLGGNTRTQGLAQAEVGPHLLHAP